MDDATSSLDTATEHAVEQAQRRLARGATRLVVAHRPSVAARADLVIWLDDGRVRAVGSHRRLCGRRRPTGRCSARVGTVSGRSPPRTARAGPVTVGPAFRAKRRDRDSHRPRTYGRATERVGDPATGRAARPPLPGRTQNSPRTARGMVAGGVGTDLLVGYGVAQAVDRDSSPVTPARVSAGSGWPPSPWYSARP